MPCLMAGCCGIPATISAASVTAKELVSSAGMFFNPSHWAMLKTKYRRSNGILTASVDFSSMTLSDFQKTTGQAFSPFFTLPPSCTAWRKVSQCGDSYPSALSRNGLMPRYGFLVTRLRGRPVETFHGLCQGTLPCSIRLTMRSVMRSYDLMFIYCLLYISD